MRSKMISMFKFINYLWLLLMVIEVTFSTNLCCRV